MIKWKLFISTMPFVVGSIGLKLALERGLGVQGWVEFSDMSLVLTAGTFLTGFMLAGTLADYKEAERLPTELSCILETIEETFAQAAVLRPQVDLPARRGAVLEAGSSLLAWLERRKTSEEMFAALEKLGERILELEPLNCGPYATRAMRELHNLRRCATRIGVISRTGFVAAGYVLLYILTGAIIGVTLMARFKNQLTEMILVPFITLIFIYMLRLIRDLDAPFDYSAKGGERGAVEVELFPLKEYLTRLGARATSVGAGAPSPGAGAPSVGAGAPSLDDHKNEGPKGD
jgi:hypothetical protein